MGVLGEATAAGPLTIVNARVGESLVREVQSEVKELPEWL